jgi:hypothetical protein
MRILLTIFTMLSAALTAQASQTYYWTVKSVACASGTLNVNGTVRPGQLLSVDELRNAFLKDQKSPIIETDNEAIISVEVSGHNTGACENNSKKTVLVVVLDKKM